MPDDLGTLTTTTLAPAALRATLRGKVPAGRVRRALLLSLAAIAVSGGAAAALQWYAVDQRYVTTDNAYVGADSAKVTPLAGGPVASVRVSDSQAVTAGQVLVELDNTDARIAVAQAEADLAKAEADHQRALGDFIRRKALGSSAAISAEEFATAQSQAAASAASRDAAKARLAAARLTLARMTIRAPIAGVVTGRQVEIGQRVEAGTPLMTIVPIARTYVDANFKEGQLGKVAPGQPATLTSDLYGERTTYHGRVVGLSGGTGSAFAIIPAQNATGNWIKVVQRVPVRISLDPDELAAHPLRVGLSMKARIQVTNS